MQKITLVLLLIICFFFQNLLSKAEIVTARKPTFNPTGRDPFRSLMPEKQIKQGEVRIVPQAPVLAPDLKIEGIVWGGKFPQVIIESHVMREGDVINNGEPITIISIKPKEVAVLFKGKLFTLYP
ncbi:MAG: hypothetical protein AB1629_00405 [Candidatus Omnitrophota bacterium]